MKKEFLETILQKHAESTRLPSTSAVCELATKLLLVLFPEQSRKHFQDLDAVKRRFRRLEDDLSDILASMEDRISGSPSEMSAAFFNKLPEVYEILCTDIKAIMLGDPAAKSEYEIIRAYPGFYAIVFYRFAHVLHGMGIPLLPRIITEFAHSKTGIDIHPGAKIGAHFFIDHGTGIVIGETAEIGEFVKLYQGVTLGALSVDKSLANSKRHPTLEDHVVIYSNATILGGETVIGQNSIVGGNVWLTKSLPANTTVYHQAQVKVRQENNETINI